MLGQVGHRFGHRNVPTLLTDCRCRPVQVIGMMVSIGVLQDLRRHARETGGFPDRHTAQPLNSTKQVAISLRSYEEDRGEQVGLEKPAVARLIRMRACCVA